MEEALREAIRQLTEKHNLLTEKAVAMINAHAERLDKLEAEVRSLRRELAANYQGPIG